MENEMKNFSKRIIPIMIAVVMAAGLAAGLFACGGSGTDAGSQDIQSTAPSSDTNSSTSDDSAAQSQPSQQDSSSGSGNTGDIGMDAVISIVLDRVPGATKNDIDELECEYDDGRIEYEGELYYNGYEYEFEIDGATGNILKWEIDD